MAESDSPEMRRKQGATTTDPVGPKIEVVERRTGDGQGGAGGGSVEGGLTARPRPDRSIAMLGVMAAAILTVAHIFSPVPAFDETKFRFWPSVETITNDTKTFPEGVGVCDAGGRVTRVEQVAVGPGDLDSATTTVVEQALASGDTARAEQAMQAAQQLPEPSKTVLERHPEAAPVLSPKPPKLEAMRQILNEPVDFFKIHLWDCCDEDGDVVEVQVNGAVFCTTPLVHRGATISIPVPRGKGARIRLVGTRDGGGGITIGMRTTRGDFLLRRLAEGESIELGVVRP